MKALVVLNPPAEDAARQVLLEALRIPFAVDGVDYEIYETRKEDRLGEIVRNRLREGFDLVVAAGGDGTVSAVSDGLVGSSIPLGIIPVGTGNLLARELNIPVEVEAAVALMAGMRHSRKIDAMRIGGRVYILNASVGISASVVHDTTRKSKSRFGRLAYLATAIVKILASKPRYLVVTVDGKPHPYRAVEVTIMNCGILAQTYYPQGPDIRIDDGHLGVWILSMKTFWGYLRYVVGVTLGSNVKSEAHFFRANKTIRIWSRTSLPVQADGDIIGTTPIEVEVLPGALTVVVPKTLPKT